MISRRKILSQSKDELNYDACFTNDDSEIWFHTDKLYRDHVNEVLNKWNQIEDEIWAKIIVMEHNRRIAKAYARASIITINGSDVGFDGYRIGINGLGEDSIDPKIDQVKKMIGQGIKLKVDEAGNILIKRLSRNDVFVKNVSTSSPSSSPTIINTSTSNTLSSNTSTSKSTSSSSSSYLSSNGTVRSAHSTEITSSNGKLERNKAYKLFDMRKFTHNLEREIQSGYPDRCKLENQCVSIFSFVKDTVNILDLPCYVLIVNIVALDILQARLPLSGPYLSYSLRESGERMLRFDDEDKTDRSIGEEIQIHVKTSETGSSSSFTDINRNLSTRSPSSSSRSRTLLTLNLDDSKLLWRNKSLSIELPSPDYDDDDDDQGEINNGNNQHLNNVKSNLRCTKPKHDDPYYSGLRAKITQPYRFEKDHFPQNRHHYYHHRNTLIGYPRRGSSSGRSKHFRSMMKKSQSTGYLDSFVSMGPLYSVSSDYSLGEYNSSAGY